MPFISVATSRRTHKVLATSLASKWIEVAVSRVTKTAKPRTHFLAGPASTALNVWWISQGESERSERSQIEDVTNYSSNVAQGYDKHVAHITSGL